MISGFSGGGGSSYTSQQAHLSGGFPVPFNLPNVLHNLLYADIDFAFDSKQQDLHTMLKFSYESLQKMLQQATAQEHEIRQKILQNPQNTALTEQLQEIALERMQATQDFKELLETMAELLTKEQYEKLLKISNLPV